MSDVTCATLFTPHLTNRATESVEKTVTNLFIMNLNGVKSEVASVLDVLCAVCRHKSHVTTQLIKFRCVLTKGRATVRWFVSKNALQFVIFTLLYFRLSSVSDRQM
jgi:hypothetical protein